MKRQIGYEGLILKVLSTDDKEDLLSLRQEDTEQIDIILNTLTLKEQEIIKLRFGLNQGMALTLREVAKKKGVTSGRIRQIEHKALRKLKHLSRVDVFERCTRSGLEKQTEKLKEENQILKKQLVERQPECLIPLEKLELSVRAYNCLRNTNTKTLGDLARKSEQELLRVKNFGRKGLKEIKEILSCYNLKLS